LVILVDAGLEPRGKGYRNFMKDRKYAMTHPTFGGSSAALKGCATRKEAVRSVFGQAPRDLPENDMHLPGDRMSVVRVGAVREPPLQETGTTGRNPGFRRAETRTP